MAIDVCSEISSVGFISPRISFSLDLNQDSVSIQQCNQSRLDSCLLDSDFNFSFSFGSSLVAELTSADELFSNGKILPVEIKKHKKNPLESIPLPVSSDKDRVADHRTKRTPSINEASSEKKKLLKEFLSMSIDADEKPTKSFWQFKRSHSLNCDSSTRNKSIIRSLDFLSRSNSTGSAPNPPKPVLFKENQKPRLQKQHSVPSVKKSSVTNSGSFYGYNSGQKNPSLRKCGSYGHGVRISPVLNIPAPYISRGTVNLFGLGSLFCNGKIKRKKR